MSSDNVNNNTNPRKQLTLHEAQVQACMCMNRILYLSQDPEIKEFLRAYVSVNSDLEPGYKELLNNFISIIVPTEITASHSPRP